MSEYCSIETKYRDQAVLVDALMRTGGWTREQVEIHAEPQTLIDYHGNEGPKKAHIIVRRKHISCVSNDLGYVRQPDGTFEALISDYDLKQGGTCGPAFQAKLKQSYALATMQRQAALAGRQVEFREVDGRIVGTVTGYR